MQSGPKKEPGFDRADIPLFEELMRRKTSGDKAGMAALYRTFTPAQKAGVREWQKGWVQLCASRKAQLEAEHKLEVGRTEESALTAEFQRNQAILNGLHQNAGKMAARELNSLNRGGSRSASGKQRAKIK